MEDYKMPIDFNLLNNGAASLPNFAQPAMDQIKQQQALQDQLAVVAAQKAPTALDINKDQREELLAQVQRAREQQAMQLAGTKDIRDEKALASTLDVNASNIARAADQTKLDWAKYGTETNQGQQRIDLAKSGQTFDQGLAQAKFDHDSKIAEAQLGGQLKHWDTEEALGKGELKFKYDQWNEKLATEQAQRQQLAESLAQGNKAYTTELLQQGNVDAANTFSKMIEDSKKSAREDETYAEQKAREQNWLSVGPALLSGKPLTESQITSINNIATHGNPPDFATPAEAEAFARNAAYNIHEKSLVSMSGDPTKPAQLAAAASGLTFNKLDTESQAKAKTDYVNTAYTKGYNANNTQTAIDNYKAAALASEISKKVAGLGDGKLADMGSDLAKASNILSGLLGYEIKTTKDIDTALDRLKGSRQALAQALAAQVKTDGDAGGIGARTLSNLQEGLILDDNGLDALSNGMNLKQVVAQASATRQALKENPNIGHDALQNYVYDKMNDFQKTNNAAVQAAYKPTLPYSVLQAELARRQKAGK